MYLRLLPSEQKHLFLDLCIHAMNSDNVIAKEEKEYIELYCNEMELPTRYELQYDSLSTVLSELSKIASEQELKIVYFEILALMLSDSNYVSEEKAFIEEVGKVFSIPLAEQESLSKALEELLAVNAKVNAVVLA